MKNKIIAAVAGIAAIIAAGSICFSSTVYSQAMEVSEIDTDTDTVTLMDANGFTWEYTGITDECIGDIEAVTMSTMFTDHIFNDVILNVRYSGYFID